MRYVRHNQWRYNFIVTYESVHDDVILLRNSGGFKCFSTSPEIARHSEYMETHKKVVACGWLGNSRDEFQIRNAHIAGISDFTVMFDNGTLKGQSGGALFLTNGKLIGILYGNLRLTSANQGPTGLALMMFPLLSTIDPGSSTLSIVPWAEEDAEDD
jgi:hypothetical protein